MSRSSRMVALIAKIKKRCDEKWGRRVELAKYLETDRQTITHILNDRQDPTGEQTLAMIEWLEKIRKP